MPNFADLVYGSYQQSTCDMLPVDNYSESQVWGSVIFLNVFSTIILLHSLHFCFGVFFVNASQFTICVVLVEKGVLIFTQNEELL